MSIIYEYILKPLSFNFRGSYDGRSLNMTVSMIVFLPLEIINWRRHKVYANIAILKRQVQIPPQTVYDVASSLYVTSTGVPNSSWSMKNYLQELLVLLNLFRDDDLLFLTGEIGEEADYIFEF